MLRVKQSACATPYPTPNILRRISHTRYPTCHAAYLTPHACNAQGGKIIIIPGSDENPLLPSVVSFLENGRVAVGQDAVDLLERHPASTIYGAKRFIGRE